jgi:Rad3-related DNA helicase
MLKILNLALNVTIPFMVCYLTNCNLIVVAASFVVTDAVLCAISDYMIIHKPHKEISERLLSYARQELQDTKERRDQLDQRRKEYKNKNCSRKCQMDCSKCPASEMDNEFEALNTFIEFEHDWIEMKLAPMKDAEMAAFVALEQKPSKENADKLEYFTAFAEKIDYFVANHNFTFLKPVEDSIDRLVELLKMKPDGYRLIPRTLYLYIDELQKVLSKLTGLQTLQMGEYMEDLMTVSSALSKSVDRTITNIEKLDTDDIEVSLSVLINELIKEEEGNA